MLHKTACIGILFSILLHACGEDTIPRPRAMLRLEYPGYEAAALRSDCPFTFQYNQLAEIVFKEGCALNLDYPMMNGSIFVTYKSVEGNLHELLTDAQKLSYEHTVKADNITEHPFVNPESGVYGMFYEVQGNAASQAQFYVTDSISHFVTGSLYFYARPNYDSIYPAAVYLQRDIRHIMESFRWKE